MEGEQEERESEVLEKTLKISERSGVDEEEKENEKYVDQCDWFRDIVDVTIRKDIVRVEGKNIIDECE